MTSLLDVNVLVALAWPNHVHHGAARAWFAENQRHGWATCGVTESGFIRVSSNRRITPDARPPAEAAELLRRMCALPRHTFLIDDVQLAEHAAVMGGRVLASAQVTDFHLLLVAQAHTANLATFDRGLLPIADSLGARVNLLSS